MTPLQLKMMLHYYAIAEPYAHFDPTHANSPAVIEQRMNLCDSNLLESAAGTPSMYRVTPRGEAFVEALCALPLPVCKWVQP